MKDKVYLWNSFKYGRTGMAWKTRYVILAQDPQHAGTEQWTIFESLGSDVWAKHHHEIFGQDYIVSQCMDITQVSERYVEEVLKLLNAE